MKWWQYLQTEYRLDLQSSQFYTWEGLFTHVKRIADEKLMNQKLRIKILYRDTVDKEEEALEATKEKWEMALQINTEPYS